MFSLGESLSSEGVGRFAIDTIVEFSINRPMGNSREMNDRIAFIK